LCIWVGWMAPRRLRWMMLLAVWAALLLTVAWRARDLLP
jgi:hypothetical protein